MTALTLGLEFITGRCVAACTHNRDEPEWPPHPGRVFMALAAACFERGDEPDEIAALQWLETLPAPEIFASVHHSRTPVKYYVPVNDKLIASKSILQSTPGLARSKQERTYPTAIPLDPTVKMVWKQASEANKHFEPLARLCANVIRVGHSSSLVRAWVEQTAPDPKAELNDQRQHWLPVTQQARWHTRVTGAGELNRLRTACRANQIERFVELKLQIESSQGKIRTEAKRVFEETFGQPYKASLRPPEPVTPTLGLWQGYCLSSEVAAEAQAIEGTHFDSELLVLAKVEGPVVGVSDCLALTRRLREAVMSHCPENPPPAWLGGHDPTTGRPTDAPHTAFLPLPFVGREYADGHLMGLALALPHRQHLPLEQRGPSLAPFLLDNEGELREIELKLGRFGVWTLRLEDRPEPPRTLRNATWTHPSVQWASVTPVVLDRYPKKSRHDDRVGWETEVREIIAQSCIRTGLPEPVEIDLDTTSWHTGSPRAYPKVRKQGSNLSVEHPRRIGDGFAPMPTRPGKPPRPQIHVYLRFAVPVSGPVLLGAGRFLGYGLCKPLEWS